MTIKLNWEKCSPEINPFNAAIGESGEPIVYLSNSDDSNDASLQRAVQESIDKAISLFADNILDNSRYFICEWDVVYSTLTIVVTDDSKLLDSKYIVKCLMVALDDEVNCINSDPDGNVKTKEYAENIKYWISNYLTTNSDFMKYSLIALFHCESRDKTELL